MCNIGYVFNSTVWKKINAKAKQFSSFDEYNWGTTMWAGNRVSIILELLFTALGDLGGALHILTSATCTKAVTRGNICVDNGVRAVEVDAIDKVRNIKVGGLVHIIREQQGYHAGFKGWVGWGDHRDQGFSL
jgi:alpha-1,6-mannosyl-glycoprotein beta-1,2-N-acetylglucosaminyltransferase